MLTPVYGGKVTVNVAVTNTGNGVLSRPKHIRHTLSTKESPIRVVVMVLKDLVLRGGVRSDPRGFTVMN